VPPVSDNVVDLNWKRFERDAARLIGKMFAEMEEQRRNPKPLVLLTPEQLRQRIPIPRNPKKER
jgi:hypothetical protein